MDTSKIIRSDRLIAINVGTGNAKERFQLQETLLRRTSDVFAAALNNEHLGTGGTKGVLEFLEDDTEAWRVLVYWIFERELLSGADPKAFAAIAGLGADGDTGWMRELLVNCWILGDKYNISQFQNLAMLELLDLYTGALDFDEAMVLAVEESLPGSKLLLLAAREAVLRFLADRPSFGEEEQIGGYEDVLGTVGFGAETVREYQWWRQADAAPSRGSYTWLTPEGYDDAPEEWEDWMRFMVAGGPTRHWVHDLQRPD